MSPYLTFDSYPSRPAVNTFELVHQFQFPERPASRPIDLSNRPRNNFIILQLRLFVAAGNQDLWAWMIKLNQQPCVNGPVQFAQHRGAAAHARTKGATGCLSSQTDKPALSGRNRNLIYLENH